MAARARQSPFQYECLYVYIRSQYGGPNGLKDGNERSIIYLPILVLKRRKNLTFANCVMVEIFTRLDIILSWWQLTLLVWLGSRRDRHPVVLASDSRL